MNLSFETPDGERTTPVIERLILSGFAGRSTEDVEHHIAEMARQGVPRPPQIPMFWPVLPHLLTQGKEVAVYGHETTPEVEYVLFTWRDELYVTLGNDQCDIGVEAHGWSERSKNLCQKTVARQAWPVADVLPHWDELELTLICNGELLQQDRLSALIAPHTLLEKVSAVDGPQNGRRMIFSGTIATKGQLPSPPYDVAMRLHDPVRGREIAHAFRVTALTALHGPASGSPD
jgi:hypothetical protein